MNLIIATGDHWFHFQCMAFKIIKAGISSNKAYAKTEPHNQTLVDELCKRIQKDQTFLFIFAIIKSVFRKITPKVQPISLRSNYGN